MCVCVCVCVCVRVCVCTPKFQIVSLALAMVYMDGSHRPFRYVYVCVCVSVCMCLSESQFVSLTLTNVDMDSSHCLLRCVCVFPRLLALLLIKHTRTHTHHATLSVQHDNLRCCERALTRGQIFVSHDLLSFVTHSTLAAHNALFSTCSVAAHILKASAAQITLTLHHSPIITALTSFQRALLLLIP